MALRGNTAASTGAGLFLPLSGGTLTGALAGTTLALGGATIGSNALAVTGTANISGIVTGVLGFAAGSTSGFARLLPNGANWDVVNGDNSDFSGMRMKNLTLSSFLAGVEETAPAAPGANGYRIFAQDNGGGKTQLMVIFASGAAQQIAIQP